LNFINQDPSLLQDKQKGKERCEMMLPPAHTYYISIKNFSSLVMVIIVGCWLVSKAKNNNNRK
jgi:hypothetical protein